MNHSLLSWPELSEKNSVSVAWSTQDQRVTEAASGHFARRGHPQGQAPAGFLWITPYQRGKGGAAALATSRSHASREQRGTRG